jgi:biofilm PGA synthesis N-glycosyltransferase PgaC
MKIAFWLSLFIAFYTFVGYGILLFIIIKIKRAVKGRKVPTDVADELLPYCTLVVAAYNEEHFISQKIVNSLALELSCG